MLAFTKKVGYFLIQSSDDTHRLIEMDNITKGYLPIMTALKSKPVKKTAPKSATSKKITKTVKTAKKATVVKKAKTAKVTDKALVKKPVLIAPVKEAFNKSQILTAVSEYSGLGKKEVAMVFDALSSLMHGHLRKGAVGEFALPGLLKCVVKRKPATKSRKGISPFTGEEMTFEAKPARNIIKVRPLKKLKEMAE